MARQAKWKKRTRVTTFFQIKLQIRHKVLCRGLIGYIILEEILNLKSTIMDLIKKKMRAALAEIIKSP